MSRDIDFVEIEDEKQAKSLVRKILLRQPHFQVSLQLRT